MVLAERVRSPDVEQNLRTKFLKRLLHRRQQRAEIFLIIDAIRHIQVDVRWRLVPGIIIQLMDGNREDGRIIAKDSGRAIAMMHIRINHDGLANSSIRLQSPYRYGDIVDCAEAFAMVRVSMVKAAAKIRAEAVA